MTHVRFFGAAALAGLLSLAAAPALADTAPPNAAQAQSAQPAAAPVTDAELRNFAAARTEIEPLLSRPQTTDTQRQETLTQMRAALQRHSLTGARYNEIVAAAQNDPSVAQRLAALTPQRPAQPPG